MSHGIDEIIRKINSKTDIPDLSPGGIVGNQPLPNVFKDVEPAEIVSPLKVLKCKILANSCQVCKK